MSSNNSSVNKRVKNAKPSVPKPSVEPLNKKLNFVFDKKSGDILAPRIVANHVVAIRDYQVMAGDKDAIFNKFPEDFALITAELGFVHGATITFQFVGPLNYTPFTEIVGDKNGK